MPLMEKYNIWQLKSNKPIAMEDGTPEDISAVITNLVTLAEVPDMVNENGKAVGPCNICYEAAKQENPKHKCRRCSNVVCSILCSIPDPESDNEMHRVHKHGDYRCIGETAEPISAQEISFDCPKCHKVFKCNFKLQSHMAKQHEEFETSFPTMSLASDGSISDIYETCKIGSCQP
jgi:hypothetical protein